MTRPMGYGVIAMRPATAFCAAFLNASVFAAAAGVSPWQLSSRSANGRHAFLKFVGVFLNCLSRNGGKILARVEQTLSGRMPAIAATFRSALTGFAPALRCHYPGQAGF